jgi:hypothetical protein
MPPVSVLDANPWHEAIRAAKAGPKAGHSEGESDQEGMPDSQQDQNSPGH